MEEKKVIRKKVFAARKAHTDQQIDDWSRKIAETVTALSEYSNSRRILAYADYNHEVMTKYIIEAAWKDGAAGRVRRVRRCRRDIRRRAGSPIGPRREARVRRGRGGEDGTRS